MSTALRPIEPRDHTAVLHLNAQDVELLAPLHEDRLRELVALADRADVVDVDGAVAGFVLTFAPGAAYDSENYVAFGQRFGSDFYYLDRIVIDDKFRRKGLGQLVYDEIERVAAPYSRLVLEVNILPPNEPSLAFHRARGFVDVAERGVEKRVLLMAKNLGGRR